MGYAYPASKSPVSVRRFQSWDKGVERLIQMGVYEDAFPLHDGNISLGFKREIPKSSVKNAKSESLSRFPTIKIMHCEIENFHPKSQNSKSQITKIPITVATFLDSQILRATTPTRTMKA